MQEPRNAPSKHSPLGVGGWLAIAAMGALLGICIWFMFWGWNLTNASIDAAGMTALVLGVIFSIVVGSGLMALVFYSNRKGYDR